MEFEWDDAKDAANIAKHGVSLADALRLDWTGGKTVQDDRKDYGELRFLNYARMGERLFTCAYVLRSGRHRIISLRKANRREIMTYG